MWQSEDEGKSGPSDRMCETVSSQSSFSQMGKRVVSHQLIASSGASSLQSSAGTRTMSFPCLRLLSCRSCPHFHRPVRYISRSARTMEKKDEGNNPVVVRRDPQSAVSKKEAKEQEWLRIQKEDEERKTVVYKTKLVDDAEKEVEKETDYVERNAQVPREDVDPKAIVMAERKWFNDEDKDKDTYLQKIEDFSKTIRFRRHGQVEFIYAAIRVMKDYGVHKDLQAYKALMDIFPKEVMKPSNIFQYMLFHFYKQQECAVDILHAMELNGVEPDHEMEELVISIFSKHSLPWRKVARQLYWFSKLRNANPYPLPEGDISNMEALELAKLALRRMCPDVQTRISVFDTNHVTASLDKTWIVSAQAPSQKELIEEIAPDQPVFLEGPFRVWLKDQQITYHQLRADNRAKVSPLQKSNPDKLDVSNIPLHLYGSSSSPDILMTQKGVHQQEDGTILALAATGTSSRDSLLSWLRILQSVNPKLEHLKVIFTLKAPHVDLETVSDKRQDAQ